ncbi:nectin-1-like [Hemiscyllium ocellatum]|uniref:nectin-1-like n=1 Tax=Hemiscyllium ocellatum TaxID=170820 RepID=UPI002965DC5C|nr:nectin-1-like [Hemiscyllium ocellatum]
MPLMIWMITAYITLISVPTCVVGNKVFLTALVGTEVLIPCQLTPERGRFTLLSWEKDHQEKPIAVYSPRLGLTVPNENYSGRIELRNQSVQDGSIRIKALEVQDEGNYTCDLAIFPQGKLRKTVHLTILAVPTNIATSVPVKAGLSEVPVAQCIAAFGKPAADITWKSSLHGNHTTIQTANSNGTVTVSSLYKLRPRRSDNGQTVECFITHPATDSSKTYRLQLEISYPPEVTITGYDQSCSVNSRNVAVTCHADANPPATTYTWRGLPEGAVIRDEVAIIGEMSAQANGNWTCEATNTIGTGVGRLEVLLRPSDTGHTDSKLIIPWVIVGVLVIAVVALTIALLIQKRHKSAEEHYINVPNQRKKFHQDSPEINATYTSLKLGEQSVYNEIQRCDAGKDTN